MKWLARALLAVALLLIAGVVVLVAGSLLFLDWDRRHAAATQALPLLGPGVEEGLVRIEANGMSFRARVAGLGSDGPGLVLLHGFPVTSAMWGPLFEPAVAAGYRVVAFDQRGYSPGARPEGVEPYLVPELVEDVLAVADAAGFQRFHLVGHDWGCVVGWGVAIQHPERLHSWSGLSIPHPGTLLAGLSRELPMYIRVFTAPRVPELVFTWNRLALLRSGLSENATALQREEFQAVFSEPGALEAAFNWYRAITRGLDGGADLDRAVEVPTLFLYGAREGWVTEDRLAGQRERIAAPYTVQELDAGHWLIEDQTEAVVSAVLEHVGAATGE